MLKEESKKTYRVYSDLLSKPFDSIEELERAEEEVRKAEEEKQNKLVVKKNEVELVKTAIKNRVEAEHEARKAKAEAYKKYLTELDEIQDKFNKARDEERQCLSEFCKKYPEGFHDTIKIGDITYKYDYSENDEVSFLDPFKSFLSWLF